RNAAAYWLALAKGCFFAEPDDGLRTILPITEDLRTLLGNQQLGITAADAPTGKLVHLDALDINGHGQSRHGRKKWPRQTYPLGPDLSAPGRHPRATIAPAI